MSRIRLFFTLVCLFDFAVCVLWGCAEQNTEAKSAG